MLGSSPFALSSSVRRRAGLLGIGTVLAIAINVSVSLAQIGGVDTDPGDRGTGGKNTIQGNLFLTNGRRLDRRIKLRLRSIYVEQFTMSDEAGAFSFRRLRGGSYTVIVDGGQEFESTSETVDIIEPAVQREDAGHVYTIHLRLQANVNAQRPVGTVDVPAADIPEEARKLYKDAVVASQADRGHAIDMLKAALKIHPTYLAALNELGVQYLKVKDLDKAEAALTAALKIAPRSFAPRLNRGIVLIKRRNYEAARDELRRAVDVEGSSAAAHLYLGQSLVGLGAYEAAEKELRIAIELGGGESLEAHRYLGAVYIETANPERAAAELETYLKLVPQARDSDKIREIIKQQRATSVSTKGSSRM
ncbi:MAG TPA: tetratricopeptide repeat protein [Blastocatellia bacterium]|nr:tetratricopeptide repeat protein [Blastocatellia bacterium]